MMSHQRSGKRLFAPCLPSHTISNDDDKSPLLNLPEELLFGITSFLDVRSLLTARQINKKFRDLASRNEAGWTILCHDLWKDKVHVLDGACLSLNSMEAYRQSLQDAKDRQCLTLDELCYDEATHTGTIWSFRFKEAAGPDWTGHDPWYNGNLARKMVFLKDGAVKQYLPTTRTTHTTTTSQKTSLVDDHILVTPNFGDDTRLISSLQQRMEDASDEEDEEFSQRSLLLPRHPRRLIPGGRQNHPPGVLVNPPMSMTWRFLTRPIDLPSRPTGSYIRLTVGGRDVPTYVVRRSPTGNWGFVLESLWGVYASFELPPRRLPADAAAAATTEAATLEPPSRRRHSPTTIGSSRRVKRLRRAASGQVVQIVDSSDEEHDSEDDEEDKDTGDDDIMDDNTTIGQTGDDIASHASTRCNDDMLLEDSEMLITNAVQWREAFLYNWGARALPDGDSATSADVDQILLGAVMDS